MTPVADIAENFHTRELQAPSVARSRISIVSPAYNESANLPVMYEQISQTMSGLDLEWEWIVVDDHSLDSTFAVINELAARDSRVRGVRFARNFGAHIAISCGLHQAIGDCCIALAADLQDPPATIPELLKHWKAGAQVVWAVRDRREGETRRTLVSARLYYWLMREIVGMRELPATGADFFLLDRSVVDAFNQFHERNVSILALITWMGYRQVSIPYDKQARLHGRSGWSLRKKLKLVVDSVTAFTYLPIRAMSYFGFAVAFLGFIYAIIVIANALLGQPTEGWSSLMVAVLIVGGVQMLMMGVLGEYLWRALDESRRRPPYLIEARTAPKGSEG